MFKVLANSRRWCIEKSNPKARYAPDRWIHAKPIDLASLDALVRLLDIDQEHAYSILKSYKVVRRYARNHIVRSHTLCLKHGINNATMREYPDLLRFKPHILEQRICFLKDLGCPQIKPQMILSFRTGLRATPNELKANSVLPPDADVTKNLLSCLHEPPPDVPPVKPSSDDERLDVIYDQLLRHYLTWKLELTEEQLNRIMNSTLRLRYQSFSLIREMLDMLLNEFGFTIAKIRNNSFLLSKSPENTRLILKEIPKIGREDMRNIIYRHSRILHQQVDSIHDKLGIIRHFKIPEDAVCKIPCILNVLAGTIFKRLKEFKTIRELACHWNHPRMLMVVVYFTAAKRHLKMLKALDIKFNSIHVLCASNKTFHKYTQVGIQRTKSKEILSFLADELRKDKQSIQVSLKRHPLWCQVPFIYVQETYIYLRNNNFSRQAIFNNVHIVLYKSEQINRFLKNMDLGRIEKSCELTDSRKLALCLYDIEKQYHFSGSGIWNCVYDRVVFPKKEELKYRWLNLAST